MKRRNAPDLCRNTCTDQSSIRPILFRSGVKAKLMMLAQNWRSGALHASIAINSGYGCRCVRGITQCEVLSSVVIGADRACGKAGVRVAVLLGGGPSASGSEDVWATQRPDGLSTVTCGVVLVQPVALVLLTRGPKAGLNHPRSISRETSRPCRSSRTSDASVIRSRDSSCTNFNAYSRTAASRWLFEARPRAL